MILVVSQYFRPEPNVAISEIADALLETGERVVVLTSHPNHPIGRFYPEVKTLMPALEQAGNLDVWRLPIYPCHSRSKIGRFISYLSFCLVAFIASLFVGRKARLAYVYQTPFTSALSVLWLKWLYKTPLVYVVVDLWPESFSATGVTSSGFFLKFLFLYSRIINKAADHIFASTQGTRDRFLNDGIPLERISFTPIWVEGIPDSFRTCPPNPPKSGPFTIVYAGNLGLAQRLDTILLAAQILLQADNNFQFHLYGNGTAEKSLKAMKKNLALSNVTFFGFISPVEAFERTRAGDAAILHLANTPSFRFTIPSKLVSMLAAGSPILCGVIGETSALLEEHRAGLIFEPENPDSLVRKLAEIQNMQQEQREAMRANAWNLYDQLFDKRKILAIHIAKTKKLMKTP